MYNQLSQLVPGCSYLAFTTVQASILGTTTLDCNIEQYVLLWITLVVFSLICFTSSLVGDSNVEYAPILTTELSKIPILKKIFHPPFVHSVFATFAFLIITIFNSPTFSCLFSYIPDTTLVQTLPLLTGSTLLAIYGMVFKIPIENSTSTA